MKSNTIKRQTNNRGKRVDRLAVNGRTIARWMHSLDQAWRNRLGQRLSQQLAFDCAEINADLPTVRRLLHHAIRNREIPNEDLDDLESILAIHWSHHIASIRRTFKKYRTLREKQEASV